MEKLIFTIKNKLKEDFYLEVKKIFIFRKYPNFIFFFEDLENNRFILKLYRGMDISLVISILNNIGYDANFVKSNSNKWCSSFFDMGHHYFFSVSRFLDNEIVRDNEVLMMVGSALANFHNLSEFFFQNRVDIDLNISCYKVLLNIKDKMSLLSLYDDRVDLVKNYIINNRRIGIHSVNFSYIHGDFHWDNIILSNDEIFFIDWDDCRCFDFDYDLASFFWSCLVVNRNNDWDFFLRGYMEKRGKIKINYNKLYMMVILKELETILYYLNYCISYNISVPNMYIRNRFLFIEKMIGNIGVQ